MAQQYDKLGNQTLYVLRTSVANFDKEKLENYRWKEGLKHNLNNVLNLGVKPENFFMDYAGVSTDGGRAQEKHPYPDKKDKMPEWFRNNKDIIEAHVAARNVSSKNIEF